MTRLNRVSKIGIIVCMFVLLIVVITGCGEPEPGNTGIPSDPTVVSVAEATPSSNVTPAAMVKVTPPPTNSPMSAEAPVSTPTFTGRAAPVVTVVPTATQGIDTSNDRAESTATATVLPVTTTPQPAMSVQSILLTAHEAMSLVDSYHFDVDANMVVRLVGQSLEAPFSISGDFQQFERVRMKITDSIIPITVTGTGAWEDYHWQPEREQDTSFGRARRDREWAPFSLFINFMPEGQSTIRDLSIDSVEVVDGEDAYVITGVQSGAEFRRNHMIWSRDFGLDGDVELTYRIDVDEFLVRSIEVRGTLDIGQWAGPKLRVLDLDKALSVLGDMTVRFTDFGKQFDIEKPLVLPLDERLIEYDPPLEIEQFTKISTGWHDSCGLLEGGEASCWGLFGSDMGGGERFMSISAGLHHSCGLLEDGTVSCHGLHGWDPAASPPEGLVFKSVSSGKYHACGLLTDGAAYCWGGPQFRFGQAEAPTGVIFKSISSGGYHTCGLSDDGRAVCWGSDLFGKASPPDDGRFVAISSAESHTCALRADGTPVCWGRGDHGATSPPDGQQFVSIAAGTYHTCGLQKDGTVSCWGVRNPSIDYGQASPPADERFSSISTRHLHTCGLRQDGTARCWGWGADRRLLLPTAAGRSYWGGGTRYPSYRPVPAQGSRLTALSVGDGEVCGLIDGMIPVCWADSTILQYAPITPAKFVSISTNGEYTCVLGADRIPQCWTTYVREHYSPPPQGVELSTVSVGEIYACGLSLEGSPVCWGEGEYGSASPPVDEKFVSIASGREHTCGLRSTGTVSCWGGDRFGQLSYPDDEMFSSIASGEYHTCGIREADGAAVCWGGVGLEASVIHGQTRYTQIAGGHDVSCALREDETVDCWSVRGRELLYEAPESVRFTTIGVGASSICGLREDGTALCWRHR